MVKVVNMPTTKLKKLLPPARRPEFAEKVGCSVLHLSRIVRGKLRPGSDLAMKIVTALDGAVTLEEVLGFDSKWGNERIAV